LTLYYSTNGDADFTGGKVYVLRVVGEGERTDDPIEAPIDAESQFTLNQSVDVEFVELEGAGTSLQTLAEYDQASYAIGATAFMRIEDVDYGKGSTTDNQTVYFAVTGRDGTGVHNYWGSGYKLELDPSDPLKGTLTQILFGGDETGSGANAPLLQSPDNIAVTENYIYWQEDPNSFDRNHQAYVWQTDLNGNNITQVMQIDLNSDLNTSGASFSGEFGALLDITDKVGSSESTFLLALQPHYWVDDNFRGIDGHTLADCDGFCLGEQRSTEGSQILILKGLPR